MFYLLVRFINLRWRRLKKKNKPSVHSLEAHSKYFPAMDCLALDALWSGSLEKLPSSNGGMLISGPSKSS